MVMANCLVNKTGEEKNLGLETGITTEVSNSTFSWVVLYCFTLKEVLERQILGVVEIEGFLKFPKVYFESLLNVISSFFFKSFSLHPLCCFLSITYYQTTLVFFFLFRAVFLYQKLRKQGGWNNISKVVFMQNIIRHLIWTNHFI